MGVQRRRKWGWKKEVRIGKELDRSEKCFGIFLLV